MSCNTLQRRTCSWLWTESLIRIHWFKVVPDSPDGATLKGKQNRAMYQHGRAGEVIVYFEISYCYTHILKTFLKTQYKLSEVTLVYKDTEVTYCNICTQNATHHCCTAPNHTCTLYSLISCKFCFFKVHFTFPHRARIDQAQQWSHAKTFPTTPADEQIHKQRRHRNIRSTYMAGTSILC